MNRRAIELYDEFTHGTLPRRAFLARLGRIAGGAAAAAALLPLLENRYAVAATVAPDDPALASARESFDAGGAVSCYVARPKAAPERRPAVIVIHENRGLNPHIEDVARRAALAGFLAIAPDALSGSGGTPANEDEARKLIGALPRETALGLYLAAVRYAASHPHSSGKVGCFGFCWGGGMAGRLAATSRELGAAVVFYGMPPAPEEATRVRVPVMMHYAGRDERINNAVPAFDAALRSISARYEMHFYADTDHAFHNDTNAARYNEVAAKLAWRRTIEFLARELA